MSASRRIDTVTAAITGKYGGVKSLYSVCEWLSQIGRSRIALVEGAPLASWFDHHCELYDKSYTPDVLIFPEICQLHFDEIKYHICFALGKWGAIAPDADLVVCKSPEIVSWVKQQVPLIPTKLIVPSIDRSVFEYDGRPKKELICYMTRPHKHPETAQLLRQRYGDKLVEIIDLSEAEVAEALKDARVFVWRGDDKEGSPRPPKEALVAGCIVVGLKSDLNENYMTDFGIRCSTVDELVEMSGEALKMPMPTKKERAVVRDKKEEMEDWLELMKSIDF